MSESRTARPLRVGLLWHSANSGNLGVGALTVANIAIVRAIAQELGFSPRFTIIGMADAGPSYVSAPDVDVFQVTGRSLLSPEGCWRVLGAQDCVLDIGAGDSFADIYGPKRFAFLWLTKVMALMQGRPLVLSPQTIGPFTRFPYPLMARTVLERAHTVVARDEASYKFLRVLAPKAEAAQAIDVAFALPYADRSDERGGPKVRVGVNVSGLLFNEAQSGSNRFGLEADYAALMQRFLSDLAAREDVDLHLVTHANGAGTDDDRAIADRLAATVPGVTRAPDFAGPSDVKSYISSLDFLVAGRMHACIAAYSAGTPVVPIAYSRKFSGLFGTLAYPWMVPETGLSTEAALAYLHERLDRRQELSRDAAIGMATVGERLEVYRGRLRDLFSSLESVPS